MTQSQKPIFTIADLAPEVHQRMAEENLAVDAIFEVRQSMREGGFPADLLTIDCRKKNKRILCVFHDQMPGVVLKEEGCMDEDFKMEFEQVPMAEINADVIYKWITSYFL